MIAEFLLRLVSLSALFSMALIFLFVAREAWPVITGRMNTALVQDLMPVEQALALPPVDLKNYLGLTDEEWRRLDETAKRELALLKVESYAQIPDHFLEDPDARVNTASWRYLLRPHAWAGDHPPQYVWQPSSLIPKYNLVPLVTGSLKVTMVALAVALPLGWSAALYVAQFASKRRRAWLKPAIELMASLPSVVIGFLALMVLATLLEGPSRLIASQFGWPVSLLNAAVAGTALGLAVLPVVFSVAEDALQAVPRSYVQAAIALGATPWQAAWQVMIPAAMPGLVAAGILGFGRAISDTMIVLMASGNAALLSWNIFDPVRTMSATIAAEMDQAVFGGPHYRMLFLVGTVLFAITFASNMVANVVMNRFRHRFEGQS